MFWRALGLLRRHWLLFVGIVAVYAVLDILLVRGFGSGMNLTSAKSTLDHLFTGQVAQLTAGFSLFVLLVSSGNSGTSGAKDAAGSGYQLILILVMSLAIIWTLRQLYAGARVRVRDGFYRGMSQLVPFVLVLLVVGLQLIPVVLGMWLYNIVANNGIAALGVEKALWAIAMSLLALTSLYMITSSLFALYIATLPDMTPLKALRSARQLVRYRRWTVMRKVVFLPLALLVMAAVVMIPLILFVTPVASWAFFALTLVGLPIIHGYMYALYRELI